VPLPGALAEAQEIGRLLGPKAADSVLLTGKDARKDLTLKHMDRKATIHLASATCRISPWMDSQLPSIAPSAGRHPWRFEGLGERGLRVWHAERLSAMACASANHPPDGPNRSGRVQQCVGRADRSAQNDGKVRGEVVGRDVC
jgi:hypothetical protein